MRGVRTAGGGILVLSAFHRSQLPQHAQRLAILTSNGLDATALADGANANVSARGPSPRLPAVAVLALRASALTLAFASALIMGRTVSSTHRRLAPASTCS